MIASGARRLGILGALVAAQLGHASTAVAQAGLRALALPTETAAHMPDPLGWGQEFDARLAETLREAGVELRAARLGAQELACQTPECLTELARRLGVDLVIGAKVLADERLPPSYHVEAWLYDRAKPVAPRRQEAACPRCPERQVAELLSTLAAAVLAGPGAVPPADLVKRSGAPDSQAKEDPPARVAPFADPAPTLPAARVEEHRARVSPPSRRIQWLRGLAIASGVVGAIGIVAGGVEAARDGGRACSVAPGQLDCPERWNTTGGQLLGFVGGAALLSAGAVLAYFGWRGAGRSAVEPLVSARAIGLQGRF